MTPLPALALPPHTQVKSSCPGYCRRGQCAPFPSGLGVNVHHLCVSHLSVDTETGALGATRPVGAHNVVGDAPADIVADLVPLLEQCGDPAFASASGTRACGPLVHGTGAIHGGDTLGFTGRTAACLCVADDEVLSWRRRLGAVVTQATAGGDLHSAQP